MDERRDLAIDTLRTAITLLVVLHHCILAYAGFGHFDRAHYLWSTAPVVDERRWAGFDVLILFNDGWFMAAMFAIAGLFVMPGLQRYGPAAYLRRRALRLGVPFVFASVVIMPLAYYPSVRLAGSTDDYWSFWADTVTNGPWSAGPAWFLWVLLAFDAVAAGSWALRPWKGAGGTARQLWLGAAAVTLGTELPVLAYGPEYWLSAGPFAVQASRIAMYAAAFTIGVCGGPHLANSKVPGQPLTALATSALFGALYLARPYVPVLPWRAVYAVALLAFCFTICCCATAGARRSPAWSRRALQVIGPDAFWIYLVHYLPMVWLQYTLLAAPLPAPIKAAAVLALTLVVSWAAAACLRVITGRLRHHRIPNTSSMS